MDTKIFQSKRKWYKPVGGDFGSIKLGNKWVGFRCLGCMEANGWIDPRVDERITTPSRTDSPACSAVRHIVFEHDKDLHREWLLAGKPLGGQWIQGKS